MRLSFWEKDTFLKDIDFAVIGSGIVGLNAALTLRESHPQAKIAVFERGTLPIGASTRNAGFACFGSLTELIADLEHHNASEVSDLVALRWRGLQKLRERCGDAAMQYESLGGTEVFRAEEEKVFLSCREKMAWFNEKIASITGNPETYRLADERLTHYGFAGIQHLILNQEEGQIHPGRMMQKLHALAIEKNILFFNGAEIEQVEEDALSPILHTKQGWEIRVGKILIAVNGFAQKLLPELDLKPARNQVILTSPINNLSFSGCFHYDQGYFYFRNIGQRVLLGGGRNLARQEEETTRFGDTELIQKSLYKLLEEVILPGQKFEIEHRWSGILGVGKSKKPIVRMVSGNIGVAVRLGGMGVAIGSLVGEQAGQLFD